MITKLKNIQKGFMLYALLVVHFAFSQNVTTSVDTLQIQIGEEIEYQIYLNKNIKSNLLVAINTQIKESKIELNSYSIDSISDSQNIIYKLKFTSFQIGEQEIPSFKLAVENNQIVKTSKYKINVIETPLEENTSFEDIKPIQEVNLTWLDYLKIYSNYLLIGLAIILLIVLIWFFFKKKKNKSKKTLYLSLHDRTIKELEQLKNQNYIQNNDFKKFYTKMAQILRNYISERFNIPAKILLTDNLFEFIIRKKIIHTDDFSSLKQILLMSDYVKFAKFKPTEETAKKHWDLAVDFIIKTQRVQEIEELNIPLDDNNNELKVRKI